MYNTLSARGGAGGAGRTQGPEVDAGGYAQARVNGGAAGDARYADWTVGYATAAGDSDYATANTEYSGGAAGAAGDSDYATANPEYSVMDGARGCLGDAEHDRGGLAAAASAAKQENVYDLAPPGQKRGCTGTVAGRQRKVSASGQARCQRPAPGGDFCKNASVESSMYCNGHTCPQCGEPKSSSAPTCPAHAAVLVSFGPTKGGSVYEGFGVSNNTEEDC